MTKMFDFEAVFTEYPSIKKPIHSINLPNSLKQKLNFHTQKDILMNRRASNKGKSSSRRHHSF